MSEASSNRLIGEWATTLGIQPLYEETMAEIQRELSEIMELGIVKAKMIVNNHENCEREILDTILGQENDTIILCAAVLNVKAKTDSPDRFTTVHDKTYVAPGSAGRVPDRRRSSDDDSFVQHFGDRNDD